MRIIVYVSAGCLGFLLGIALSSTTQSLYWLALIASFLVVCIFLTKRAISVVGVIVLCGLVLGWLRFTSVELAFNNHSLGQFFEQDIALTVEVIDEVERLVDKQRLVGQVIDITYQGVATPAQGHVLVTTELYPEVSFGDVLRIQGTLRQPTTFSYMTPGGYETTFAYDTYLRQQGIHAVMWYPDDFELLTHTEGLLQQRLFMFKQMLLESIQTILTTTYASFLGGLILGSREGMDPQLLEHFARTGTTHIVALSGFNITILGVLFFAFLPWLGIKRQVAFWLVLGTIGLFVIMTGAQASVVRAGVMGALVLIAYFAGRPTQMLHLILLTAVGMAWWNPFIVVSDLGFQLSFVATLGLLYIAPLLEGCLQWLPARFGVRESVSTTLAAIIATLPLIIFNFGKVSVVALFANMLILPIIPVVMAFGFVLLILIWVWPQAALIIAGVVWALLHYSIVVVTTLAQLPFAEVYVVPSNTWLLLGMYVVLLASVLWYYRHTIRVYLRSIYEC